MKRINGIFYAMLSASAFGVMPILAKIAYSGGANAITVLIFRFFFAALIISMLMKIKKISFKITKNQFKDIFIYGGVGSTLTCLTLFLSYNYMSVGMATTLHFIYPIVVTVMSVIFFKEKLKKSKIIALILSAIGIYLLVGGGNKAVAPFGIFLALISGVFYSIYMLGVAHSSMKKVDTFCTTFYLSITTSGILFLVAITTGNFILNIKPYAFAASLGISFVSTVIALVAFIKGVKIIGPSSAAVLSTLEPIVSLILGVIILNEQITTTIIIGSLLILISVIIITIGEK